MPHIIVTSVLVDDQDKALAFYRDTLGFIPKTDIPMGEYRWLTVVGTDDNSTELLLEPDQHPAAKTYKQALIEDGIPLTSFAVDDIDAEHHRLTGLGVRVVSPPTDMGPVRVMTIDDTCGNLIQLSSKTA
ncbi:VOC family protein [Blastococcus sp. Marseille-P5729]|uniref:VOC family protein n=1 Tax=Blastococcus sp. Marseille-P5729 TaxID=2086582 RepID=UPI000D1047F2|nr:VOC family protein [Blastococcus sp. Marseille-P5729]